MKRTNPYFGLKWIVSCKWPHNTFYEPMAAFNDEDVAIDYMAMIHTRNAGKFAYQIQERIGHNYEVRLSL